MLRDAADTSRSLWLNLPTALIVIFSAVWACSHFNIELSGSQKSRRQGLTIDQDQQTKSDGVPQSPFESIFGRLTSKAGKHWREDVKSPVVEEAWETLCGSIIQEVRLQLELSILPCCVIPFTCPDQVCMKRG